MPYSVYVIELDKAVRQVSRFRKANPDSSPLKPSFYVGCTARTPEVRFEQHLNGYKGNSYVKRFGKRLRPDLYQKYNPIKTRADAEELEEYVALRLRAEGHGVWFN
ncbi:MAG: GIY-YIG nuclease family protein [Rhodothermales bacterium]|nr:GIY-YIG nuclease family protein [Rhodothermales bacterium]